MLLVGLIISYTIHMLANRLTHLNAIDAVLIIVDDEFLGLIL